MASRGIYLHDRNCLILSFSFLSFFSNFSRNYPSIIDFLHCAVICFDPEFEYILNAFYRRELFQVNMILIHFQQILDERHIDLIYIYDNLLLVHFLHYYVSL